jgi:Ser/Thr protein kinase RdoA (MazF antagonist)
LIRSFVPPDGVDVPVHGDVNFRNWLVDGVRLALIDLDQVGRGRPEADLGGALAGLRYRTLIGVFDPSTERQLARALLDGYARVRPLPNAAALDWHTGAALFVERALRAVTRFRSEGLLHLGVLVAHAQRLSRERED